MAIPRTTSSSCECNNVNIIRSNEAILITGANGFIGSKVFEKLLEYGFKNLRCFIRSNRNLERLRLISNSAKANIEFFQGDLFNKNDCIKATKDVVVIYHLAIGPTGKSFPNAFFNTVIPTRNLLEAILKSNSFKRFVNISSFAVYSNRNKPRRRILDEQCPLERQHELQWDAYGFAKLKQDEIVKEYANKYGMKYVTLRLGAVYGPEDYKISGRVGIDTFGVFMHLGGPNRIPLTYIDNCAEAIALAGLKNGIDGEVFNVVDDDLISSRRFLQLYKRNVRRFKSIYLPHAVSYILCYFWEKYSKISKQQLPPVFNRKRWHSHWKMTRYSNQKIKTMTGWKMKVPTADGLKKYFDSCRERIENA